jgi:hypothetical protein
VLSAAVAKQATNPKPSRRRRLLSAPRVGTLVGMREGRPRAVRSFAHWLGKVGALAACVASFAAGCAAEVNTAEEPEPEPSAGNGAMSGSGSGGKPEPTPSGGKAGSGGSKSGGTGGSINAFGGSASTGGKPSGGAAMGGSAGSSGGKGGTAGAAGGGGAGGTSGGGGAKNGGAGGMSGTSAGGSGGSLACLDGWQGDTCDSCSKQTQGDKLACVEILNCYAQNSCGPSSCANNDDKCGANKIGKGTAGYPIAKDVYDCLCQ